MPLKERPIVPEKGETNRTAGKLLIALFLAAIALPALIQVFFELAGRFDSVDPKTGETKKDRNIQSVQIFTGLKDLSVFDPSAAPGKKRTLLEHIQEYESALEDRSVVSGAVQPPTQWLQLLLFNQGNEKVVVSPDRWLFYRSGLDFVTGPGFGRRAVGGMFQKDGEGKTVDPLPIILNFSKLLKERGIDLVLLPVPVKASIYPERLKRRYDANLGPPVNKRLENFCRKLEESGIHVIDITKILWNAREKDDLFLRLDTHWTPRGMDICAAAVTDELKKRFPHLEGGEYPFKRQPKEVTNYGDVFDMLKLPAGAKIFEPQTVTIQQVFDDAAKKLVKRDRESPIVVLGDSATNIYSIPGMKWGEHAGLAQQLAFYLKMGIDWISIDGGAPSLTREKLAQQGLRGKKLIIWEFIMRDLTDPVTPWEDVPFPECLVKDVPKHMEVKARIVKKTDPADADAAELYPNTTTYTLYKILEVIKIEGKYPISEILAVEWDQKDMDFMEARDYMEGDEHHLVLIPLIEAEEKDSALRSAKFVNEVKRPELPAFWVVEHKKCAAAHF